MMDCKRVAALVSRGRDSQLPLKERVVVRLHLAMCALCRGFSKQLEFIHRLSTGVGDTGADAYLSGDKHAESLSTDARARIKRALSGET